MLKLEHFNRLETERLIHGNKAWIWAANIWIYYSESGWCSL